MATEINSMIGSGTQRFRQENRGRHHRPAHAVHVVNWEDTAAVHEIRTSGLDIVDNATILPSGTDALDGRRVIAIYNNGSDTLYVGPSGVTENTGYPVVAAQEKAFAIAGNLSIYAIAAAGTSINIRIMEMA